MQQSSKRQMNAADSTPPKAGVERSDVRGQRGAEVWSQKSRENSNARFPSITSDFSSKNLSSNMASQKIVTRLTFFMYTQHFQMYTSLRSLQPRPKPRFKLTITQISSLYTTHHHEHPNDDSHFQAQSIQKVYPVRPDCLKEEKVCLNCWPLQSQARDQTR